MWPQKHNLLEQKDKLNCSSQDATEQTQGQTTQTGRKYLQNVNVIKDLYPEHRVNSQNSTTEEH